MLLAWPRIKRSCSSSCWTVAGLPSTMTRVIWLSASRKPVALLPVIFSVPCVSTTLPVQMTLPGCVLFACCWVPSNAVEVTLVGWSRSDFLATAGRLVTSATPSTAKRALALARRIDGVDCIEELQMLGIEIGAHANAIHCRGSLNDPGCLRRLQTVLLGPGRDLGGIDAGRRRLREGDAVHVDLALQLQQAAVLVHPAVLGMPFPRWRGQVLGRWQDEVGRVDVQRLVVLAALQVGGDQLERRLAEVVVGVEIEVGQHIARTRRADEVVDLLVGRDPVIEQHARTKRHGEHAGDARGAAVLEQEHQAHSQRSRSASALPWAARIRSATSRAAP